MTIDIEDTVDATGKLLNVNPTMLRFIDNERMHLGEAK